MTRLTPLRAMRAKCLDCCCGSAKEVRLCPMPECPLYAYRLGKDPARSGKGGNIAALRKFAVSEGAVFAPTASDDPEHHPPVDHAEVPQNSRENGGVFATIATEAAP